MESGDFQGKPFDGGKLTSWKEIATYLGVSVRTAQKWEHERALPVHRLPGGRGMVLISVAELDRWLHQVPERPGLAPDRRRLLWFGGAAAAGAVALVGGALWRDEPRTPSACRVDGENLVVVDRRGTEIWRRGFGFPVANGASRLHPHLQNVRFSWIGDIDGDGQEEVLFLPIPERPNRQERAELYCFSADGTKKWQFRPGGFAASFREDLRPPYSPLNFLVFGAATDRRIALASVHHTWHPSQIAILDGTGALLQEYWHSGHLIQLGLAPNASPGSEILLAGGISNGYRSAVLIALNPNQRGMRAASKEAADRFQLPGTTGQELARILFPRSRINLRKGPYNVTSSILTLEQGVQISVSEDLESPAEVIHTFGPGLEYRGAGLSSNYIGRYSELRQMGLLKDPLNPEAETEALRQIRRV